MKKPVRALALLGILGLIAATPALAMEPATTPESQDMTPPMQRGMGGPNPEQMKQRAERHSMAIKQHEAIKALIEDKASIMAAGKIDKAMYDKLLADLTSLEETNKTLETMRPARRMAPPAETKAPATK